MNMRPTAIMTEKCAKLIRLVYINDVAVITSPTFYLLIEELCEMVRHLSVNDWSPVNTGQSHGAYCSLEKWWSVVFIEC